MKRNFKILFRTAGGKAIGKQLGLGHVNRCVNLAHELTDCDTFFLIEDYGGVKDFLKLRRIKNVFNLKNGINTNLDVQETKDLIIKKKIDVLVVDKFDIRTTYLKRMKEFTKVVVISDLEKINFLADLVVNGFISFKNKQITNKYGTKCLVGPNYQILNQVFKKQKSLKRKKYDLLVTFGGFDEKNLIDIFLDQFSKYNENIKAKIILGPATKKSDKVKNYEKRYRNNLVIVDSVLEMAKEIAQSKFGLCSGGITSYEFACLNVPFAIICQVKHQLMTAKEWERKGVAINFGLINNRVEKKLAKFLEIISENKNPYKLKRNFIIDGFGSSRVAQEILNLK